MSFEVWLTFVVTALVILVVPGPTNIYVVGQSLAYGRKASVPLSIGVIVGDAMCITISLLGLSALLSVFSAIFMFIKYLGAIYLIYLGFKMVLLNTKLGPLKDQAKTYNSKVLFRDIFWVNALNPKGIIFYSAFMPQFVSTQSNIWVQFIVLALTFLGLALINVVFYSLVASKASELFQSRKLSKVFNLTGGLSLICAGVYSATIERK
ncbi:LysE family translocator [Desulfospira joergensenii]|uniref:LysE family translocator n=1 Tax=Desulfospira joergensenii TaxID=53329 RepID=UPI0003B43995|nr:LysE family translocator [Desulfospira joergensenii]